MDEAGYQPQGPGRLVPGRGDALVLLLERRGGLLTILEMSDGRRLRAFNVAAGRDMGDEWEHATLNISPEIPGEAIDFISVGDVSKAIDAETSAPLYVRTQT